MPLRQKLFLVLSLMTVVPFLILLFGVVGSIERDLGERIEGELHGTLDKMSAELEALLRGQKSLAKGLARVPAVTQFAEVALTNHRDTYQARARELESFFLNYQTVMPSIQALRFIDPGGKTLVKVKEGHEIQPSLRDEVNERYYVADQSYKPFFRRAVIGQADVSVSDFELGQVAADADFCPAMLRYSVPIRDELETLQGLLVVNMWGKRVDETVQASLGGHPGNVYIVEINEELSDRDGIYLYHNESQRRFANQVGTEDRFPREIGDEAWLRIKDGGARGSLLGNGDRMFFYARYRPFEDRAADWLLLIEVSRQAVFAPIYDLKKYIWILMGILVVLSLLIARWVSNRMARPVHGLANLITHYADGDHTTRYAERRNDDIGLAGRAFNYLCENLERTKRERDKAEAAVQQSERLAAVGQLAAGIGHEINNPLMNIMSLADLVEASLKDHDDAQVKSDLGTLRQEGQRCARIVQGILNFARASEPSYREFDMAQLVSDTSGLLHHRLDAAGLTLNLGVDEPLTMLGDPNLLQQVLVNVLLNAIHAAPRDSVISVNARERGESVLIEVLDRGGGISETDIQRVFNPFFTTKPEGAGTGLGLSVSYGIVKKHGGTISLENRKQGGVRVQITLPVRGAPVFGKGEERLERMMEAQVAG